MTRYILIDNDSGYIWGDSADLEGKIFSGSPTEYAKALDDHIGVYAPRQYGFLNHDPHDSRTGYHVYSADEAVPIIQDGQSRDEIDTVVECCPYIGFVSIENQ